jgi:MFS family permease
VTHGELTAAPSRRLLRLPAVLGLRDFRRFWIGETVSLFGDQITLIALPLTGVLALHASAADMGYLTAAEIAPALVFSLHAGAWFDRRGRRRQAMIVTVAGRAALLVTIPIAFWLGVLTLAQLYVVAFLIGTLSTLFFVAYTTLFVALVPRERYLEGNALLNGSRAFSFVGGPSVGGALVQALSAPAALLADAASFLVAAFTLGSIEPVEPPTEEATEGHVKAGLRYLWRSPVIRASLLATATINLFNFVFWALFLLYAVRTLHLRPGILGLVLGVASIGGVLGSILTGRISRRVGVGPAFIFSCVLFTAPLVLVPFARGPHWLVLVLLVVAEFLSGFGVMVLDIVGGSIKTALIPDRLRARVAGAYMVVNYGVRPVGALLGGALGTWIGLRPTLWIASTAAIAGVLWLLPSPFTRMRELPEVEE